MAGTTTWERRSRGRRESVGKEDHPFFNRREEQAGKGRGRGRKNLVLHGALVRSRNVRTGSTYRLPMQAVRVAV